jgi:hypothetical protein
MGALTVTVGPVSASLPFDNTTGSAIINGFIEAQEGPVAGTNAEKLQWYVERIGEYTRDTYRQHKRRAALVEAEATVETELEQW